MILPGSSAANSAGLSGSTVVTNIPEAFSKSKVSAINGLTSITLIPSQGCEYDPWDISEVTTLFTVSEDIAKFSPGRAAPVSGSNKIRSFTPMTSPFKFNNGPPEFPGLISISV